jgi:glucose/arabinose dehydrogenase
MGFELNQTLKKFIMKASTLFFVVILLLAVSSAPAQNSAPPGAELTEVWRTEGVLSTCESVLYNPERDLLFVSCINGSPAEKNEKGFIALLQSDGSIKELHWVTGLNAPKGMGIHKNKLYVADIDQLVVIDIKKGKVTDRIPVEGASFLNDIAIGSDGKIYFTDSCTLKRTGYCSPVQEARI